jgi:hypothetical protein
MIHTIDNHGASDSYAALPSEAREHIVQATTAETQPADLDAKGLLLRDALAILTVVGALVAFYGMIKLVSYLSGIPFP